MHKTYKICIIPIWGQPQSQNERNQDVFLLFLWIEAGLGGASPYPSYSGGSDKKKSYSLWVCTEEWVSGEHIDAPP